MDDRLRRLERAAVSGDPEARARLWQARVRAGQLTTQQMQLAALLGDPTAREVSRLPNPDAFADWVRLLTGGGKETCVRAVVAAAKVDLEGADGSELGLASLPLQAAEAWIECPCLAHARDARTAAEATWAINLRRRPAARTAAWAAETAGRPTLSRAASAALFGVLGLPRVHRDAYGSEALTLGPRHSRRSEEEANQVRAGIVGELLPWLQESSAPLRPTERSTGAEPAGEPEELEPPQPRAGVVERLEAMVQEVRGRAAGKRAWVSPLELESGRALLALSPREKVDAVCQAVARLLVGAQVEVGGLERVVRRFLVEPLPWDEESLGYLLRASATRPWTVPIDAILSAGVRVAEETELSDWLRDALRAHVTRTASGWLGHGSAEVTLQVAGLLERGGR